LSRLVIRHAPTGVLVASALALSGCQAVEAVFRAGAWVGALGILLAVALVAGIVALVRGATRGTRGSA
jgi:hypothetical protein